MDGKKDGSPAVELVSKMSRGIAHRNKICSYTKNELQLLYVNLD